MTDLHSDLLQTSSPIADKVEGRSYSPTFDIQMHATNWLQPGQGEFRSSRHFIEMICSESRLVEAALPSRGQRSRYVALGDIAFIGKGEPLHCRWQRGSQRTISCSFDIEDIAARMAVAWQWPDFDWASALTIRNDYIAAMLRRITAETLTPGFASECQIETLLLGIAFELRRQFSGAQPCQEHPAGKLSHAQLGMLEALAIDTPGGPPSIGELSEAVGIGGRQLAARFRATTGQTLRRFLAESRLERAKLQLGNRQLLIKQVAFDCGFRSSAAFAAAFYRRTGMTPQTFRRSMAL